MSRYRRHKDAAHPGVVEALKAAGALVVVLDGARWAGGGRKQQTAGAPDLIAGLHGRWVALEVKTPGQDRNRGPKAREQLEHQRAFRVCADLQQLPAFVVSTPLEALAAMGCTPAETMRGPTAAYVPPRTDFGPCLATTNGMPCQVRRFGPDSRYCAGHHNEDARDTPD